MVTGQAKLVSQNWSFGKAPLFDKSSLTKTIINVNFPDSTVKIPDPMPQN
jgi:hypothetical protein